MQELIEADTVKPPTTRGAPCPQSLRDALETAVLREGLGPVAKHLGLSKNAVLAALSGLPVHTGTRAAIAAGLAA